MKLACVIHRFGEDIVGGSEAHCRALAERLAAAHEVTVLTSCARDYVTWKNAYPAGSSRLGALRIVRFPVARPRRLGRFAELSELVFSDRATIAEQEAWFRSNGPEVPDLLAYLEQHGREFDRVLFWSYRYYPAFFGVPLVPGRAILVPTAEEDPLIRAGILGPFFRQPDGYLFLTPEERALIAARCAGDLPRSCVIGSGLDPAPLSSDATALDALGIEPPFFLYLGRVEPNKGCEPLLRYFLRFAAGARTATPLVLAGPVFMELPQHPLVRALGIVSPPVREVLLSRAHALIVPSPFESLSLALLEAWNHARPALVNGRCQVLKGQVRRADGGLHYSHINEFVEGLRFLQERTAMAAQLGRQGLAYVEREYRWPVVMEKVESFLTG